MTNPQEELREAHELKSISQLEKTLTIKQMGDNESNIDREDGQPSKSFLGTLKFNPCGNTKILWPYVATSGLKNSIWLYCAFDHSCIKRLVMPYDS